MEIRPVNKRYEIELIGAIAHRIRSGAANHTLAREPLANSVKMVAGAGFEPATFRL